MKNHNTNNVKNMITSQQRTNSGSVTVEMVLVTPILLMLLFGIIEFGLIFKDIAILKQATREGVRTAAVGQTTTQIISQVQASAATISSDDLTIELKYRVYSSGWPSWDTAPTLGNIGSGETAQNDALPGAQIRAQASYPHQLISGRLFSGLADSPDGQTMTLTTSSIMRRE